MAQEVDPELELSTAAPPQPENTELVRRDDDISFIKRKSRLLNVEIPAALKGGVHKTYVRDFQKRTLGVLAPTAPSRWPGSVQYGKYLESLHAAHAELDTICEDLLEVSCDVIYTQARLEITQLNLYSPRRQDIQRYRDQIDGVEELRMTPAFFTTEDDTIAKSKSATREAVLQWNTLKTKLQGAVTAVKSKGDLGKEFGKRSVRFSTSDEVREFEADSEEWGIDWEGSTAISDSRTDLEEESGSKLFTTNKDREIEVNGKLQKSPGSSSATETSTSKIDLSTCHQPTNPPLKPYQAPGFNNSAGYTSTNSNGLNLYPTPPPSSPLAPIAPIKAPLKSILIRKNLKINIHTDDNAPPPPPAKRRKRQSAEIPRPATPPMQGIELKAPARPVKKPSPEIEHGDGDEMAQYGGATMNQITREAKSARAARDGLNKAEEEEEEEEEEPEVESEEDNAVKKRPSSSGNGESTFFDESTLLDPFGEGWAVMKGSP